MTFYYIHFFHVIIFNLMYFQNDKYFKKIFDDNKTSYKYKNKKIY